MRRASTLAVVFVTGVAAGLVCGGPRSRPADLSRRPAAPAAGTHGVTRVTLVAPDRTVRDLPVLPDSDRSARPGEWGLVLVTARENGTRTQVRLVLTDAAPIPGIEITP